MNAGDKIRPQGALTVVANLDTEDEQQHRCPDEIRHRHPLLCRWTQDVDGKEKCFLGWIPGDQLEISVPS